MLCCSPAGGYLCYFKFSHSSTQTKQHIYLKDVKNSSCTVTGYSYFLCATLNCTFKQSNKAAYLFEGCYFGFYHWERENREN